MGLSTTTIKAIDPDGNVIWMTSHMKTNNDGEPVVIPRSTIDRGIRESIGYSGKYTLEVK